MVALAFNDSPPVVCRSRPLLKEAAAAVEREAWVEAGLLLLDAVRLFLLCDCQWYGVDVSNRKVRETPETLLERLTEHGDCDDLCHVALTEAIEVGRLASRGQSVKPWKILNSIGVMHAILDSAPYPAPTAAGGSA